MADDETFVSQMQRNSGGALNNSEATRYWLVATVLKKKKKKHLYIRKQTNHETPVSITDWVAVT